MNTHNSRRFTITTFLVFALTLGGSASAGGAHERSSQIRAMTQNLYVGADLLRILAVTAPEQIPMVIAQIFGTIQMTNFPARARAIADAVKQKNPDVIGLQEVSLIRVQTPSDYFIGNPNSAETVAYDYLEILQDALRERGLHYRVASQIQNVDVELPAFAGVDPASGTPLFNDVRLTDRDVILVRNNVRARNRIDSNFNVNLQVPIAGLSIPFTRGYTRIDATVRGTTYHVVNTHLEVKGEGPVVAIQALQAQELTSVLATETKPLVLLGDLNSPANDTVDPATGAVPPYMQLAFAGYKDSWLESANADLPGYTCCQAELLMNIDSIFDQRIDYVLYRGEQEPDGHHKSAVVSDLVGESPEDKTADGLWPSDHAGVYARIHMPASWHQPEMRH